METLIAFLVGAFIGVLITSLTVFAAFKMVEEEKSQSDKRYSRRDDGRY